MQGSGKLVDKEHLVQWIFLALKKFLTSSKFKKHGEKEAKTAAKEAKRKSNDSWTNDAIEKAREKLHQFI